ncbi:aldehyde dehydrogenase family protein [Pseudalkalibacillus sp. A8]|uniref:aldehyde dehydrogenase family protein n=1 Tax=Pseudalkalibacillus sp. A8 TaxID=3382641 RepID=UPI0038B4DAA0
MFGKSVKAELGQRHDLLLNGERIRTEEEIVSRNPANTKQVVGYVSKANQEIADQAVEAAAETFKSWRKWCERARAELLFRAANIIRRRKHEFSVYLAVEIYETPAGTAGQARTCNDLRTFEYNNELRLNTTTSCACGYSAQNYMGRM